MYSLASLDLRFLKHSFIVSDLSQEPQTSRTISCSPQVKMQRPYPTESKQSIHGTYATLSSESILQFQNKISQDTSTEILEIIISNFLSDFYSTCSYLDKTISNQHQNMYCSCVKHEINNSIGLLYTSNKLETQNCLLFFLVRGKSPSRDYDDQVFWCKSCHVSGQSISWILLDSSHPTRRARRRGC